MNDNPLTAHQAARLAFEAQAAIAAVVQIFMLSQAETIELLNKALRDNWDYKTNKVSIEVANEYFAIAKKYDAGELEFLNEALEPDDVSEQAMTVGGFALSQIIQPELNFLLAVLTDSEENELRENNADFIDKIKRRSEGDEDVPIDFGC